MLQKGFNLIVVLLTLASVAWSQHEQKDNSLSQVKMNQDESFLTTNKGTDSFASFTVKGRQARTLP